MKILKKIEEDRNGVYFFDYKIAKLFSYCKNNKFEKLFSLNVMKLGPYSQNFIFFATYKHAQ